ncbi:MAG: hypothetical protein FJ147_18655 [Deltaproteobacteria bacterium]|nr:hypothetical protein [Deltaproteobacteria bacterium]
MKQNDQALKVALAAAQQLSPQLQRQLAEQLLTFAAPDQQTTLVSLRRLSPQRQARLEKLMDKHNEGRLTQGERRELQHLSSEVDQLLLTNSQALARALRPELFDERGKPIRKRFQRAVREPSVRSATKHQEARQG